MKKIIIPFCIVSAILLGYSCTVKKKSPVEPSNPSASASSSTSVSTDEQNSSNKKNHKLITEFTKTSEVIKIKMTDTLDISMSSCFGCAFEGMPFDLEDSKGIIKLLYQTGGGRQPEGVNGGSTSVTIYAVPTAVGKTFLKVAQGLKINDKTTEKYSNDQSGYQIEVLQ